MLNTVGYNFTYVHLLINVFIYVEGNSSSNDRGLPAFWDSEEVVILEIT